MKRIIQTYEQATIAQIEEGISWYPLALEYARSLDTDVIKSAGVIAALSPRVHWETNKKAARKIILAAQNHSQIVPQVAGTYLNKQKAWRIANGEDPEEVLQSCRPQRWLKVRRFYHNILGDTNGVTVDVWTARVVLENPPEVVCGSLYLKIENSFQKAAKKLGLNPRDLQAICWIKRRYDSERT